jgi:thioredoxin reductase (NADPH)
MYSGKFDVAVIGEGIAGLSAARRAAQSGIRVATFETLLFGGLVVNVNHLDPSPVPDMQSGAELAASLYEQCAELGVESIQQGVIAVEEDPQGFVVRTGEAGYHARQLVVASGARLRRLGVPGEDALAGLGVSNCADCDGPLYRGRDVVVVGGGDSALQETLVLAEYCRRVYLVNRAAAFTGRPDFAARVAACDNVEMIAGAELERIDGGQGVERVTIRRLDGGAASDLACSAVFAYVGLVPNSGFLPAAAARDASGHLLTDPSLETSMRGAFAAGAGRSGYGGSLVDATREGEAAGSAAAARIG